MAIGFGLRLDADAYLLAGVPLTAAFQLLVRRRPLRALWLREPPAAPRFDLAWAGTAALLAALPVYSMSRAVRAGQLTIALWCLCAVAGAGAAAFALRNRERGRFWREVARCLFTAGAIGVAFMILAAVARHASGHPWAVNPTKGLRSLLLYFPVCFTLEEVSFRGALDSHLAPDGARWPSAILVSALWGLWHLPVVSTAGPRFAVLPNLLVVHVAIGVPLSFAWRRSGNLAVPALAHATIDAVRNALGSMG
jgi:membrane protease YdiL (CAAX protease family)